MALNTPVLVDVVGGDASLDVTWDQVSGTVLRYAIYYGTAPGSYIGTKLVTPAELSDPANPNYVLNVASGITLTNNVTYWVAVSAVEDVGGEPETAKSSELSAITSASVVVLQPKNLVVAVNNGAANLSWDAPVVAVDGYTIEYTTNTGSPRIWNGTGATQGNSPIDAPGNITQFNLTGLTNVNGVGAPYFFRVTAYKSGTDSAATEEEIGIPQSSFTASLAGSYTKIRLNGGNNIISIPLEPNSFPATAYEFGKFLGAQAVIWKEAGSSALKSRPIAAPTGNNVALAPGDSLIVVMGGSATKYLIGGAWQSI